MNNDSAHYPELLRSGDTEAIEKHLRECPQCEFCFVPAEPPRTVWSMAASLPSSIEPVAPIVSELAYTGGLLLYAFVAIIMTGSITRLDGMAVLGVPSFVLAGLLIAGLATAAVSIARLTVPGRPLPLRMISLSGGALFLFLIAASLLFPLDWSRGLRGDGGCLLYGAGVAAGIAPLLIVAAKRRRACAWNVIAPVFGIFTGTAGLLALLGHCPILEASHLALAHWPAAAAAVAAGTVVGGVAGRR